MASCGWLVVEFAGGAVALPYRCSSQARKVPEKQGSRKYLAKSLCASQTRHSYYFEFVPPGMAGLANCGVKRSIWNSLSGFLVKGTVRYRILASWNPSFGR